jgi:hypothetical protein
LGHYVSLAVPGLPEGADDLVPLLTIAGGKEA